MDSRQHRVLVQFIDSLDTHDHVSKISLTAPDAAQKVLQLQQQLSLKANVELINEKTMLLSVQDTHNKTQIRSMNFDSVGQSSDMRMRSEISGIANQLIVYGRNACMIKIFHNKSTNQPIICQLLLSEVDKLLHELHGTVSSIKLEYFDIQKFDVVSLLVHDKSKKNKKRVRNQFKTTLDLHKWLQSTYGRLWGLSTGHDSIDLEFTFLDGTHTEHKVTFSFFSIYLNRMDPDTRGQLLTFFEDPTSRSRQKTSLIAECLREYYRGDDEWYTVLVFDVPVANFSGGRVIVDMLRVASAAYESLIDGSRETFLFKTRNLG